MSVSGHAISDAWLAMDLPRPGAKDTIDRVWDAIAESEEWQEWYETHIAPRDLFTVAYFEERDRRRLMVRGTTLSAYVPAAEIREAHRAGSLEDLAEGLYVDIYHTASGGCAVTRGVRVHAACPAHPSRNLRHPARCPELDARDLRRALEPVRTAPLHPQHHRCTTGRRRRL